MSIKRIKENFQQPKMEFKFQKEEMEKHKPVKLIVVVMLSIVVLTITYTYSFAANYPLEIIQPRAGLDTKNRFYKAYPGLEYNVRVAVIGGAYPFTYSLTTAPSGMTINANTGEITWPNPTTVNSPYSVSVSVTDLSSNNTVRNNFFIGTYSSRILGNVTDYSGSGNNFDNNRSVTSVTWNNANWTDNGGNTSGITNYNANGNKPSPYYDLTSSYNGSSVDAPIIDYDGINRNFPPDIGAFEYISGAPDTTPPSAPSGLVVN